MDFDTFFAGSRGEMLARALVLAGCRQDAEDAVQEAYAAAWTNWDRISGYDNPGGWVYKLVRQRLWKSARRWRRVSSSHVTEVADRRATDGDPERFVEAAAALAALAELPDRQRMVLVMHCLRQMEQREIANELGLSRGAVAASIFKGRRRLEKALGMTDTDLAAVEGRGTGITPDVPGRDPITAVVLGVVSWLSHVHRDWKPPR